ncbi:MAG: DNA polymerase III subunit delta [Methylococcales bacterium]
MRIKPEQLTGVLQKGLMPVYFITGDEPLQLGELADEIRKAARKNGYDNREIVSVETGFEWNQLAFMADSLSIFADKKIIDLRLPSGTPGVEGSKALIDYCDRISEDTILLITAGKIDSKALKSRWVETLDKQGLVIQVWPLEGQDLIRWIQNRMQFRGLVVQLDGIQLLAARIEGNLLAAAQEIEKLYVLYGAGSLSVQQINDVVADSSRYDVFKLMDTVLSANVSRIIKVLSGLRSEGTAAPIVLWALTRDARLLIKLKLAMAQGQNQDTLFKNHNIWDKRKLLISQALKRLSDRDLNHILVASAIADRQIKGQQAGDPWESLLEICLNFASSHSMVNIS